VRKEISLRAAVKPDVKTSRKIKEVNLNDEDLANLKDSLVFDIR